MQPRFCRPRFTRAKSLAEALMLGVCGSIPRYPLHWNRYECFGGFFIVIEEAIKSSEERGRTSGCGPPVGTVGHADCGDMLRMWIKLKRRMANE